MPRTRHEWLPRGRPQMLLPIRVLIADDQRVVRDGLGMLAALIDGAHGYLTKDASAEQIEAAIRAVCARQTHRGPPIQERLVAAVTGPPLEQAAAGACPLPAGLTAREAEVLTLLAAGSPMPS